MKNVRALAARVLREAERRKIFVDDALESAREGGLSARDRSLLTLLANGVTRHRLTLDHLLVSISGAKEIEPDVLEHLRVGLFQVLFLRRIPPAAAIDEAVELAKKVSRRSASFANAVLRKIVRLKNEFASPADPPEQILPNPYGEPVSFSEPVFEPGDLATRYSHPSWLVERWTRFYGDRVESILAADNLAPPITARVNRMRCTREDLLSRIPGARPGKREESIVLEGAGKISSLPEFKEGLFQVQDETAMGVAPLLEPREGERFLDLCAAPGGKATHLAELLRGTGRVVAVELKESRVRPILESARRLGLGNVSVVVGDAATVSFEPCDGALLDAPCSNTGVLARRVDARWRLREKDIRKSAELQKAILRNAARLVRPGGRLVYSTCSIECEENEDQIRAFIADSGLFVLETQETTLPSPSSSGGFASRLRRQDAK